MIASRINMRVAIVHDVNYRIRWPLFFLRFLLLFIIIGVFFSFVKCIFVVSFIQLTSTTRFPFVTTRTRAIGVVIVIHDIQIGRIEQFVQRCMGQYENAGFLGGCSRCGWDGGYGRYDTDCCRSAAITAPIDAHFRCAVIGFVAVIVINCLEHNVTVATFEMRCLRCRCSSRSCRRRRRYFCQYYWRWRWWVWWWCGIWWWNQC